MRLSAEGLKDRAKWEEAGYALPKFDREKVTEATKENPFWIHFVREIFSVHFRQMWYRTC